MQYFNRLKKEFTAYSPSAFAGDVMAGITVSAVALPLALAFGVSSGATAASGMITAILAGIVIGLLSGASYQISGPTGAMAAILVSLASVYGMNGMLTAGLISGILLILAAVFRLGRLVAYIPSPVITGFTSGIALVIALGQVDNFFGTTSAGTGVAEKFLSYGELGFKPHLFTVLFGVLAIATMIFWPKKWNAKVPGSLIAIIVCLILNMILKPEGVAAVGEIPRTILSPDRLRLDSIPFKDLGALITPAISIAALGMIESLLCGASAGKMKDEKLDADPELIAQGVGNILLPFFGGIPATAAIARTSVAIKSGQRTRITGIVHSLILLASMFLLSPFMSQIPLSALAGVLMVTAWRMNEWHFIKYIFRNKLKFPIIQYLVTMVVTLFSDLTVAIVAGVVVSMVLYAVQSDLTVSADKKGNTAVLHLSGVLFFGSQEKLLEAIAENTAAADEVILDFAGLAVFEDSVAGELCTAITSLKESGKTVRIEGLTGKIATQAERAGITALVQ